MILMAVGEHDSEQAERRSSISEIGEDQLDAGIGRVGEGHAEINHDPLP